MNDLTHQIDKEYSFNEEKINLIRKQKPWMGDPKHFNRVLVSPSALIKMMSHAQSGVDKGISKGGKPIEIMGLLLGRPDVDDSRCLIITDAQALPIEGFETRVVADDESVLNYMIELGDSNESTRLERFCGWYHSHPFDVDVYSNCFLSSTDISTQLQWQRSEDPHGNPWLAIVIDPLRSIAKSKPELGAFRVYPPEYESPANETPDGTVVMDNTARVERWGAVWNRYYQLKVEYYMSSLAQSTLSLLKHKFLWQATLASDVNEADAIKEFVDDVSTVTTSLRDYHKTSRKGGSIPFYRPFSVTEAETKNGDIMKATQACVSVSSHSCQCCTSEKLSQLIFAISAVNRR